MKIFFELSGVEKWTQIEYQSLMERIDNSPENAVAGSVSEADAVLLFKDVSPTELRQLRIRYGSRFVFCWESSDFPAPFLPGLYCSLNRTISTSGRNANFCYPITYNECVEKFPLGTADRLVGFHGGVTAPIRSRIAAALDGRDEALLQIQNGPWEMVYNRSRLPIKEHYAQSLQSCQFFVCPRGNGKGSIRLFETMMAQRVPIIISDGYLLPQGIDWDECAVIVREKDIHQIPEICRDREPQWEAMARSARKAWEARYSDANMLDSIACHAGHFAQSFDYLEPAIRRSIARMTYASKAVARRSLKWIS